MINSEKNEGYKSEDIDILLEALQGWKHCQFNVYDKVKQDSELSDSARFSEKGYYKAMKDMTEVIRMFLDGVLERDAKSQLEFMLEEKNVPADFKKTLKKFLEEK